MTRVASLALLTFVAVAACGGASTSGTPYVWDLPSDVPLPRIPEDNSMTVEKVALGRHLFHDSRVSVNQTYSCATCHQQIHAFSDGQTVARGCTGQLARHNTMSLTNAAFNSAYTWGNPLEKSIEHQMLMPMFSQQPVELGLSDRENEMLGRLRADPQYLELFGAAFPGDDDPFQLKNFIAATASFVRTLVSVHSPYAVAVRKTDLSPAAARGSDMFFSERLECYHCHGGFNFSDATITSKSTMDETAFHNTGLYNLDGKGAYPAGDRGIIEITNNPTDMGRFRAPTLLNIAVTGPYFHDGSGASLKSVIAQYGAAGRNTTSGPNAGDGRASPLKESLVLGFTLTEDEQSDLLAFFDSLTDQQFLTDARYANPFVDCPPTSSPTCPTQVPSYTAAIAPILNASCTSCHASGSSADALPLTTYEQVVAIKDSVLSQVRSCTMPPPITSPALSAQARTDLIAWLACGAPNN